MRILIWNNRVSLAGGMERIALSIANGLVQRGHYVVLTGPYSAAPMLQRQIDPRINFVDFPFLSSPLGILRSALHLRQLVRREGIQVISANGSLYPLLMLRTPVVWTEHGPRYGFERILSGIRAVPWRIIQKRLQSGNWHLVGCSEYVRQSVSTQLQLPCHQASVIYHGVPNADTLRQLPPPVFKSPYKIGFLGRLEPEKYPLDIFVLRDYLRAAGLVCEWHIFGHGSLLEQVKHRTAEAGRDQVFLHGLAHSPQEAFKEMDILAFLSHGAMEGLPTVLLEARLARRPAVAWNVTCNPEAIGDPAWLVDTPFDLKRFAEKIADILLNGTVPEEVPEGQLSYDRMVDEYAAVLSQTALKGA